MENQFNRLAYQLGRQLIDRKLKLVTAESCTGGWVSQVLTAVAGSSQWFEGGVVSYSNAIKHSVLGVPQAELESYGAVSEPVARSMATGVLKRLGGDCSIAITGIAGPSGGSAEKPVGTVWIGWASELGVIAECFHFEGDRQAVRLQSVLAALEGMLAVIDKPACAE